MIKLYDYFRSSASFRVRIALNLKGLEYQAIPIHLTNNGGEQHSAQYQAINPQELVPALADENNLVTQSLAIIEYLEERYPTPSLLPNDIHQRAIARSLALQIAADIHPLNNLRILNYLKHELNVTEDQKNQWHHHWTTLGFAALEKQLSSSHLLGDYCLGNTPTIADIFLVPQMFNARRFNVDLSAYPTLVRIDQHCQQQPAFRDARPQE